jgi:hypothetical protein
MVEEARRALTRIPCRVRAERRHDVAEKSGRNIAGDRSISSLLGQELIVIRP